MDAIDLDKKKELAIVRATNSSEKVANRVVKVAHDTRDMETTKYIARKLADEGVIRMDRHPSDGSGIARQPPKSGHGGKYTWEGPEGVAGSELSPFPPAVDEGDPNYADEGDDIKSEEEREYVVGVVEVAKVEETGVGRIDVDPKLKVNLEI